MKGGLRGAAAWDCRRCAENCTPYHEGRGGREPENFVRCLGNPRYDRMSAPHGKGFAIPPGTLNLRRFADWQSAIQQLRQAALRTAVTERMRSALVHFQLFRGFSPCNILLRPFAPAHPRETLTLRHGALPFPQLIRMKMGAVHNSSSSHPAWPKGRLPLYGKQD